MVSRTDWPEEDRAYNGQQEPQKRELTPRERDVLCRIINFVVTDRRYAHEELSTLMEIRDVVNPRTPDEDVFALVQHDVQAGPTS